MFKKGNLVRYTGGPFNTQVDKFWNGEKTATILVPCSINNGQCKEACTRVESGEYANNYPCSELAIAQIDPKEFSGWREGILFKSFKEMTDKELAEARDRIGKGLANTQKHKIISLDKELASRRKQ